VQVDVDDVEAMSPVLEMPQTAFRLRRLVERAPTLWKISAISSMCSSKSRVWTDSSA